MAGYEDQVEALFKEEAALSWMEEMSDEQARGRFGRGAGGLLIVSGESRGV